MVGTTISHYKVIEKVGQAGVGEVYRADHSFSSNSLRGASAAWTSSTAEEVEKAPEERLSQATTPGTGTGIWPSIVCGRAILTYPGIEASP